MRRYETVSGVFFGLLATVQLVRLVIRWPVQVASVSVPLRISALAVLISGWSRWVVRLASCLS